MEEKEITPAPDYVKGFNEGYTIAKHMPELSEKLITAIGDTDRGQGFKDGKKQLELEKSKEKTPKWLQPDRIKNIDKVNEVTKQKDKDNKDKDR